MINFNSRLLRFEQQGEKTGWTFIEVPLDVSESLNPGVKKSYRVKGSLDHYKIKGVAMIPMGAGVFIIPINASMRKGIAKKEGATILVSLSLDTEVYPLNPSMLNCIQEYPIALNAFNKMPRSHQNYYSKWIDSAKTATTQEKRLVQMILALEQGLSYAEMIRLGKDRM
jgi:hypothetical protein